MNPNLIKFRPRIPNMSGLSYHILSYLAHFVIKWIKSKKDKSPVLLGTPRAHPDQDPMGFQEPTLNITDLRHWLDEGEPVPVTLSFPVFLSQVTSFRPTASWFRATTWRSMRALWPESRIMSRRASTKTPCCCQVSFFCQLHSHQSAARFRVTWAASACHHQIVFPSWFLLSPFSHDRLHFFCKLYNLTLNTLKYCRRNFLTFFKSLWQGAFCQNQFRELISWYYTLLTC